MGVSSRQARDHSEKDDVARFPSWLVGITLALTFLTFALVVRAGYGGYHALESFRNRESRIRALHGMILRLDEVLTMSARMAAATGDSRWEQRYRRYDPQLDAAIAEAKALVPGGSSIAAIAGTDAANVKLVAMENSAFALVRAGHLNEAHAVLSSPAYETQKVLYSTGLDQVLKEQKKRLDGALVQARQRASLSLAASVALLLFSTGTWIIVIGRLRGMQGELKHRIAERTAELSATNVELLAARNAAERAAQLKAQLARESALILNSATDGILGIGLDNRPTFLNPAGARMLGITLSDLEAKSIHETIHHSYADGTPWPEADCANTQAMRRGESFATVNDTFWRRDGTSFPVEYSSTSIFDEDGSQRGAVVMFRDVTERRAIEQLKSEFVSTVSHELRTPLTSIRGALGLLSSGLLGPIAEKGQRMLEIAVSNTDRLVRLINDILDLERMESGKVELVRGPVDANAVMVQALEGVQSMADQAGVRLVIVPATGALWGDSDRIIQTLTNLLGNAIKFSPPDTTVTLSGAAREADFVFSVADQGRGVPEQKLETIFERFSQVDASDSRDKGGSGLGLAICQSIVHAHGGRIWAEKNDPAGSRFQFTIPLAVPSTVAPSAIESPASRTILVCQDDWSPNIVEVLECRGFRVVRATSSADVIARAANVRPDAIILDVANGGNGRQIVEALKSTAETCDVPIVVVTGQFPESYESYAAAVANWVRKPLKSDDLIHALDLAFDAPSILVVEDDLDLARVMNAALQSHGIRTLHAVTGSEAVQLCRQHEPSLIVLDLVLPDMDGFAVVSALRESATLGRIPLLVYSALDVGIADQSRLRLGPTEFLTKSRGSLADFEARVVRLLETVTNRTEEGQHAA
jgi:PAS domain S-box-containing protein